MIRRGLLVLLLALATAVAAHPAAADTHLPRRILALYHGGEEPRVRSAAVHQLAALPMNWLGLVVDYADVRAPLPPVWEDEDVLGVVSWFQSPQIADGPAYLDWAERVIASGRRYVVMGDIGVSTDIRRPGAVSFDRLVAFYAALGIEYRGGWSGITYDSRLETPPPAADGTAVPLGEVIPPFEIYVPRDAGRSVAFTVVSRPAGAGRVSSHVGLATPKGGFVAPGFTHSRDPARLVPVWHLDPFAFFAAALGIGGRPAPDVATLVGRRVYYSHIDGDGWLSRSTARPAPRGGERPLASEVIRATAIEPFPDLPVTVAPIAAELDPAWVGTEEAQAVARAIFALPQVEPASHTYTHPFQWDFFDPYDPAREAPFAADYARTRAYAGGEAHEADDDTPPDPNDPAVVARRQVGLRPGYVLPRAYGGAPFDMDQEMAGAAAVIARFVPPGKRIGLVQWSGDTSPTPGALRAARAAGLSNINGGDSRMDADFPTVASVAPLGRRIDGQVQVYASASNENTYTALWRGRFHGFRDVVRTWDATGAPRRIKPVNLYYHMYSGEKPAGLRAVLDNLADARRRELAPVTTSDYVRTVEGFFAVRLVATGPASWRVEDRGALQTLRFAVPEGTDVDPAASTGVLGSRRYGDQLYVALDPAVPTPVVALAPGAAPTGAWLVHARWPVRDLQRRADGFSAQAAGFGPGEMVWRVPVRGPVAVTAGPWRTTAEVGADGLLSVTVPAPPDGAATPVRVDVRWRS